MKCRGGELTDHEWTNAVPHVHLVCTVCALVLREDGVAQLALDLQKQRNRVVMAARGFLSVTHRDSYPSDEENTLEDLVK